MYQQPGAKWEGGILVAVHAESIPFTEKRKGKSRFFYNFFGSSLRMLSIRVLKRPGVDSARKSEGAILSANSAFLWAPEAEP